jgi:predicted KAP-like P-loop ATPase
VDRPDGDRGYSLRPQGAGDGNGELTKLTMLTRLLRRRRESRIEGDEAGAAVQADQLILADEAIKVPAQDSLGRGPLVERICAAITAWPNGQPLVVAITGSWGEGKTSVVNLVLQEFRRTGDHVIVEFDPWFFNSAEALIQGFLTSMEETLLRLPEFGKTSTARKGWRAIRGTLSSLPTINVLGSGVDFSNLRRHAPPVEELRTHVAVMCASLGRKVVVVVDDVDRLTAEDMRTILKLVKVWNSFSGFVFLLAFDRAAVEGKLEQELKSDPLLLEKLVQVEIRLPTPDARAIARLVDAHVNRLQETYGKIRG